MLSRTISNTLSEPRSEGSDKSVEKDKHDSKDYNTDEKDTRVVESSLPIYDTEADNHFG